MIKAQSEFEVLKSRLKATWMDGDFGKIARYAEAEAEQFVQRRDIKPGMDVLDVACGTGNSAIPAAKAGANVTGVDIAANLLEQGRIRAQNEGLSIQFDENDAEDLPYPEASFDLIISMWGAMFAPRPERVASELIRVCRPGGQIVMANWTPDGWVGQLGKAIAAHVPPPPNIPAAVLWGDEATIRERFREGIAHLELIPMIAVLKFPLSVTETVNLYCDYYGPFKRMLAALPEDKQTALRRDLEKVYEQSNHATDGTTHIEAEYLEVVATRA